MKILFVCWANVGRSQIAAELYNKLTGTKDAKSAGTEVMHPGKTLSERRSRRGGTYIIDVMKEDEGIDVSKNTRTQIDEDMLDEYDKIISMAQPEYTPEWLSKHPRYVYWEVSDPMDRGISATRKAKREIEAKVKELIRQKK